MVFNVTNVHEPILMTKAWPEWQLFLFARSTPFWLRQTIQLAIECKEPPARRLGKRDPDLLQSGAHTVGAQFGILLCQLPHLVDSLERRFARRIVRGTRFIIESRMALYHPAPQHLIHPMARRL